MMPGNIELSRRGKLLWLLAALAMGAASQWCVNYGACAAPGI